jgi:hypothetical protein
VFYLLHKRHASIDRIGVVAVLCAAASTTSSPSYRSVCGAPKPGTFTCFALRRTNVDVSVHAQASTTAPRGEQSG